MTRDDVKPLAQARIHDVLAGLGIRTTRSRYLSICNPMVKDRHPSLTIWLQGAVGAFKDHRGIAQGDVIDLVAYLKGWSNGNDRAGRKEAFEWLADFLGLTHLPPARRAELAREGQRQAREREKQHDETLAINQARAFKLWCSAGEIAGTPVQSYLRARCIDPADLPKGPRGGERGPHVVRALAAHEHSETGERLPCMIAGCVSPATGEILAVHRTWLAPDGRGKADVHPVKKVWPAYAGLVIPLWRGASRLRVSEAIEQTKTHGVYETLVLTEGIEDGLSAVFAAPEYRVWTFISLGNLVNVKLPPCFDSVIIHRQNEWANLQAVAAFDRGRRAIGDQGIAVHEAPAMRGKDLNDARVWALSGYK